MVLRIMSALPPKAYIVGDAGQTTSWPPTSCYQSKSHSFSVARTPIRCVFMTFFSRRNHANGVYGKSLAILLPLGRPL